MIKIEYFKGNVVLIKFTNISWIININKRLIYLKSIQNG